MLIRSTQPGSDFNGFCRSIENVCGAVDLRAFDFFEGVINALFGHKKTESKGKCAKNDYFINGLHIQ